MTGPVAEFSVDLHDDVDPTDGAVPPSAEPLPSQPDGPDVSAAFPTGLAPLAEAIDRAAHAILRAGEDGRPAATLHVSPTVYASIEFARARELDPGQPLVVLGLKLAADEALVGDDVRVS
jgi:hypothetical protein